MHILGQAIFIACALSTATTATPTSPTTNIERRASPIGPGGLIWGPGTPEVTAYMLQSPKVLENAGEVERDFHMDTTYATGFIPHAISPNRLPGTTAQEMAVMFSIVAVQPNDYTFPYAYRYSPRHGLFLQVYEVYGSSWGMTSEWLACFPKVEGTRELAPTYSTHLQMLSPDKVGKKNIGSVLAWRVEGVISMDDIKNLPKVFGDTQLAKVMDARKIQDMEAKWVSDALVNLRKDILIPIG